MYKINMKIISIFSALIIFVSIFVCIVLSSASSAKAQNFEDEWEFYGSFLLNHELPNVLFFFEKIEPNDSFEFRRAMRTNPIDTIVLASDGGAIWEALTISGIISDKALTTYIPLINDGEIGCFSACAFMFFAGHPRIVEGSLGVHQFGSYDPQLDNEEVGRGQAQQITQFTTSEVIGFLNEFDTPPWVYERMFRSREVYTFDDFEKSELTSGSLDEVLKDEIDQKIVELFDLIALNFPLQEAPQEFSIEDEVAVKDLQALLKNASCSPGPEDGLWGRRTADAVRRFANVNNLEYNSPVDINVEFLDLLKSGNFISCPPLPPIATPPSIAQYWNFSTTCQNRQILGTATIRFQQRNNVTNIYKVNYSNSLGHHYEGTLYLVGRNVSFTLQQVNGTDTSRGNGDLSTNWTTLSGTTDSGCRFVASAK